ncbi:hypothetical protein SKAU_G00381910 [Synaphobranchus kaupii]|uniref:Uncharacterized protein n=1 Tax=Synaphobranchus kaupii TaxID=118154 RepID=A0A9Q1EDW9_SYNKA|nr:hypothetical protein SKAU_G00381910 [Synaphobranchus kaupii]
MNDHRCGSQGSSLRGSRGNLSARGDPVLPTDMQSQPIRALGPPAGRRNILVMKHSYSQDDADRSDDDLEDVPTPSHRLTRHDRDVQRSNLGYRGAFGPTSI